MLDFIFCTRSLRCFFPHLCPFAARVEGGSKHSVKGFFFFGPELINVITKD